MQPWKRKRIYKIWTNWCDRTTFHGFNELQYLTGRPYKAAFWTVAILLAFGATAYEIGKIIDGYFQEPTAIKIQKVQTTSMGLPDVIACSGAKLSVSRLKADGASDFLVDGIMLSNDDIVGMLTRYDARHLIANLPEPPVQLQLPDKVADAVAAFETMVTQTDAKVDKLAEVIRARYPKRSAGTKGKSRTIKRGNRRKSLRNLVL